jgi:D-lactate dehydrogenase
VVEIKMPNKIAFYEIEEWEQKYLQQRLKNFELEFFSQCLNEGNVSQSKAEILSVFVGSKVTPKVLECFPNLKFITTRSTGFDHINLETCQKRNIPVSYVPTYGENTVAEFTFTLLLALSRKIYPAVKRVREESLFGYEGLQGFDLKGKTIGVVGTGHIGTYVVKIAHGFGMNILAYDPCPKDQLAKEFNFEYVSLENLLKKSDVITLHVPYMPATHHLINQDNINLCKKGSVLINTARGGLVDSQALVEALVSGRLAGAGLDVLEEEGFIKEEMEMLLSGHPNEQQLKTALVDHKLMQMENVIITPHNAFNTKEAMQRILDTTIANVHGFSKGMPINLVKVK